MDTVYISTGSEIRYDVATKYSYEESVHSKNKRDTTQKDREDEDASPHASPALQVPVPCVALVPQIHIFQHPVRLSTQFACCMLIC